MKKWSVFQVSMKKWSVFQMSLGPEYRYDLVALFLLVTYTFYRFDRWGRPITILGSDLVFERDDPHGAAGL